jgi:hypothetical protein
MAKFGQIAFGAAALLGAMISLPASADVTPSVGVGPVYYGPPPGANCDANSRLYNLNRCSAGYYGPPVAIAGDWSGHWHDGHFFYDDKHPKP